MSISKRLCVIRLKGKFYIISINCVHEPTEVGRFDNSIAEKLSMLEEIPDINQSWERCVETIKRTAAEVMGQSERIKDN